ncbi:serine hydrolase [Bythopirellula polymerisocia]|uniref:beta-lactamase n=1 Tax=Bythopirellula polymerisocia TaxID=2528003 RepID=A0A5C6CH84_9BACT|nr:serine hydrolase [Bythopirellula polymerisocia]TWU23718.1 Carbapenem-hydrolyzing beta-lactamase Sme-1 precursor [Bythopirellula polymerisocia]
MQSPIAQRLQELAGSVPGKIGYQIARVDGEVLYSQLSDEVFPQASAIKVPLLMEVLAQREEAKIDWNAAHPILKKHQAGGSGVLFEFSDGCSQICTQDLCTLMIVLSDNTATNMLIELVGMASVNQRMESLGLTQTRLQRVMMDMDARARGEENVSTPREACQIMCLLAQGKFINQEISDELLGILRKPKSTAIRNGIPAEIAVATKPGAIPGVATEWALIEYPKQPYVAVFMGKEGSEKEFNEVFTEMTRCIHESIDKKE